jgi:hypothetical protein
MRPDKADTGGGHTFVFHEMGQDAYGACAARSDGEEQSGIDTVLLEEIGYFTRRGIELVRFVRAADGIVKIGQAADNAVGNHFAEAVDGKNDVTIALITGAVETGGEMRHDEVVRSGITGDNAVKIIRVYLERPVVSRVQSGSGYNGYTALTDRRRHCPGIRIESWLGKPQ